MWKAKLCCLLTIFSIPGSYFFSFYITSLGELIHSHCLNVTHVVTDDSQIWTFSWDMFLVFANDTSLSGCSTGAWLPRWQNLTTHLPPITCLLSFVSLSWSKSETWFVILTHLSIINLKSYHFSLLSLISLGSLHFSPSLLPLALDHILSCIIVSLLTSTLDSSPLSFKLHIVRGGFSYAHADDPSVSLHNSNTLTRHTRPFTMRSICLLGHMAHTLYSIMLRSVWVLSVPSFHPEAYTFFCWNQVNIRFIRMTS